MSDDVKLTRAEVDGLIAHADITSDLLRDLWAYLEGQNPYVSSGGFKNVDLRNRLYQLSVASKPQPTNLTGHEE
jgi:hypothetical protein